MSVNLIIFMGEFILGDEAFADLGELLMWRSLIRPEEKGRWEDLMELVSL